MILRILVIILILLVVQKYCQAHEVLVYNDLKEEELMKMPISAFKGVSGIVINNYMPSFELVEKLNKTMKVYVTVKYYRSDVISQALEIRFRGAYPVLDAENYNKLCTYSYEEGRLYRDFFDGLLPENLGGEKYEGYDDFIKGLKPKFIFMERTYNEWKPWELIKFWLRNKYLRDRGIKTYIGIWPGSLPDACQHLQDTTAYLLTDGIFWYSETKELPK